MVEPATRVGVTAGLLVIFASVAHDRHVVALPLLKKPDSQLWHWDRLVAAVEVENVFRGQAVQAVLPTEAE